MAQHCGYVIKVENLTKHPNADRLQLLHIFGTTTTVGLDVAVGDMGIYFPTDLQLSIEYCIANHLCRKNPLDGTADSGYMDGDKRNVTAIKLRGERSDGIYVPLSSLATFGDTSKLKVGDTIDTFNGHLICEKYIPKSKKHAVSPSGNSKSGAKKAQAPIAPLFTEHVDTSQLAYNLGAFKPGDEIEITLKMHGTSQRTAYVPVLKGYKCTFWDWLLRRPGKPVYEYGYVSGTRRTILNDYEGGFYGSNAFRKQHADAFVGKLWKGETVYYEVVGFTDTGAPIMGDCQNKKLNDKEFVKQYGDITRFSYGCDFRTREEQEGFLREDIGCGLVDYDSCVKPQSDLYVYRMTMTNEDGDVVEYTPDFMRYRCEQMGVKTVPVFSRMKLQEDGGFIFREDGTYSAVAESDLGEFVMAAAEEYYDGPDPIGKSHVREGVVVRILNRPKFTAYKHKNFSFKCLEGIVKADAEAPDMEEAQDVEL